jgi:hypothetical protein
MRYTVSSEVVLTPEQFAERLQTEVYDTIVAEYPSPNWQETQALEILHQDGEGHPAGVSWAGFETGDRRGIDPERRGELY